MKKKYSRYFPKVNDVLNKVEITWLCATNSLLVQALTTDPDPRVLELGAEQILAPWTLQSGFRNPAHSHKFVYCLLGDNDTFGQTNTHN